MRKKWMLLLLLIIVPGLIFTISCTNMGILLESKSGILEQIKKNAIKREHILEKHLFVHEAVIFDLNKASLTHSAKKLLIKKAEWLLRHPNIKIIIEGRCDSQGANNYNFILGERRSKSVKDFMVNMGIEESRMNLISLGEEDPVDCGQTEEELVKNRRVNLIIEK